MRVHVGRFGSVHCYSIAAIAAREWERDYRVVVVVAVVVVVVQ